MRRPFVLALTLSSLLLVGAACQKAASNADNESGNGDAIITNSNDSVNSNENENVNEDRNTNENENENADTNASTENEDSGTVVGGALTLEEPEKSQEVKSPFTVKGKAIGTQVFVRVENAAGQEVFTEPVTIRNGEFEVHLKFSFSNTTSGAVIVFQKDASGNEINAVSVPVKFTVEAESNENENSNSNENNNTNTNDSGDENANENSNANPY